MFQARQARQNENIGVERQYNEMLESGHCGMSAATVALSGP